MPLLCSQYYWGQQELPLTHQRVRDETFMIYTIPKVIITAIYMRQGAESVAAPSDFFNLVKGEAHYVILPFVYIVNSTCLLAP